MFTNRQITILFYLISNNEGLNSNNLSTLLNVSTKTIQLEIKKINKILKNEEQIIYIPKKGYVIENISEETKSKIISVIDENKNKNYDSYRGNKIITILLFESNWISMEKLANRLFISKSAINNDLALLSKFRTGTEDYKLEVSLTKGLKIHASESTKRYMFSKTLTNDFDLDFLTLSDYEINFHELESKLRNILELSFIEFRYIVSGEALQVFKNFLLISIIRNKYGFYIEETNSEDEISSLMKHITKRIKEELGFEFGSSELVYNQRKLGELNVLYSKEINNHDMDMKFSIFIDKINEDLGINFQCNNQLRSVFLLHMEKLLARIKNNHDNSNFYKREINRKYPMAAHIVSEYFIPIFDLKIPESEIAYIVLYIASQIEVCRTNVNILIVSDVNRSLIYNSKIKIEDKFTNLIGTSEIIPFYLFNAKKEYFNEKYDIVLTTEKELLLFNPNAILIKTIVSDADLSIIGNQINKIIIELEKREFNSIYNKLIDKDSVVVIDSNITKIEEIFDILKIEYIKNNYDIVLDCNAAFFPKFMYGDEKSFIKICILKYPIKYRTKDIKVVIISGYNIKDKNIKEFYSLIRHAIQPNKVNYIVKNKIF